jgi:hypothetical protein
MMMMPPSALSRASDPQGPADGASSSAARALKRLWLHEALRVFYDRLVDAADREWLLEQLRGSCRGRLGEEVDGLLAHLPQQAAAAAAAAAGSGAAAGAQGGRVGQEELRRWAGVRLGRTDDSFLQSGAAVARSCCAHYLVANALAYLLIPCPVEILNDLPC